VTVRAAIGGAFEIARAFEIALVLRQYWLAQLALVLLVLVLLTIATISLLV
jgi:hypothetical protein